MKRFLAILVIFLAPISSFCSKEQTFFGRFIFPAKTEIGKFCVYFNGVCVPVENKTYIFRSEIPLSELFILVTDIHNVYYDLVQESSTPVFYLKQQAAHRLYKLTKIRSGKDYFDWIIASQPIFDCSKPIPLNTLCIFIDPEKTALDVTTHRWKTSFNGTKLPEIKLHGDMATIEKQLLKSCVALELNPFHAAQKAKVVEADNLSLVALDPAL